MKINILKNIIIFILCISFFAFAKDKSSKIEYTSVEDIREMAKKEDIRGVRQYQERRKKNDTFNGKRLPTNPSVFYENWPGWGNVLPSRYMILEEIKEMAIKENIENSTQYFERRKKNPTFNGKRLPSHPTDFYPNWPGWGEALGHKIEYVSVEEIREMAEEEGIQNSRQYRERRNKNPIFKGKRLPADPSVFYKNWPDWGAVLVKSEYDSMEYTSVEDIREMAKKEDIRSVRQYNERREKNDTFNGKRLPSTPSVFYENWPSWGNVLPSRYMILEDIREMAEEEGIQTSRQYRERREKNDTFNGKRLPADPSVFYKNWPGWGEALGKNKCEKVFNSSVRAS